MVRKFFQMAAVFLSMLLPVSLFGCGGEKPFMLDGPDMERTVWSEFTISRCTPEFETIYSYTVKHDNVSDQATLYVKIHEGQTVEESIVLDKETTEAFFDLDVVSFPDAEPLTGTFLGLAVIDSKGQSYQKQLSSAGEQEILALLTPYIRASKGE